MIPLQDEAAGEAAATVIFYLGEEGTRCVWKRRMGMKDPAGESAKEKRTHRVAGVFLQRNAAVEVVASAIEKRHSIAENTTG